MNSLGFALDQSEVPTFISSSMPNSGPLAQLRKTRTQRATLKTDQSALLLWQAAVVQKEQELLLRLSLKPLAQKPFVNRAITDRPALQRLLADIKAGKIDVIVVYKVDRLYHRSLGLAQFWVR